MPRATYFYLRSLGAALCVFLATATTHALAGQAYELRGQLVPSPGRALVILSGITVPYTAQAETDPAGRFRFKKLQPGTYTIYAFVRYLEDTQRTIEVGPGRADLRRRISVSIPLSGVPPSVGTLQARHTVPLARLTIPRTAKKELDQAKALLKKNDLPAAIGHLEKAVEIAPQFAEAWNNLGVIAFKSRRYTDAELHFRKALDSEPGTYLPSVNLGAALLKLARPDEAFKYNLMAIGSRPRDPQAVAQMGINCMILGLHDQGMTYLREVKRLDPGSPYFPQLFLVRIYVERSEGAAAIGELEDFLARHPDAPEAKEARLDLEKLRAQ